MKLTCLIIDDEPVARKGLEEYVNEIEFLQLVAQCENPVKASPYLSEQNIDLIFLDIHMPKVSGIEFLKGLRNPPLVIFTTAYSDYALEGYSLDVVDYLMKPITFERFLKAAQKAFEVFQMKKLASEHKPHSEYFFVKSESKFEKVNYAEVRYVESLQNYVIIHTTSKKLITYMTLSSIENQLPKDQFLKVHKSFIVSIGAIKAIDGNEILIGDSRIPISRNLKDQVVNRIIGNNLFKR
ncbi:MAG TPA: LytTR family DNA-binding domain-containing protein [Chryseolinea sp.]|nr:LytTR family DNA-binding domain-containing protein [Chryseolinea sp.]